MHVCQKRCPAAGWVYRFGANIAMIRTEANRKPKYTAWWTVLECHSNNFTSDSTLIYSSVPYFLTLPAFKISVFAGKKTLYLKAGRTALDKQNFFFTSKLCH